MASITDAIDFANFDEQNDTNGSGIDTSDTFNNWRKKTNGIINELKNISVFAKANILISNPGSGPAFALSANSHNISSLTYVTAAATGTEAEIKAGFTTTGANAGGAIRVEFTEPAPVDDYLVFLQMNKKTAGTPDAIYVGGRFSWRPTACSAHDLTATGLTISTQAIYITGDDDDVSGGQTSMFHAWTTGTYDSISLVVFT